MTTRARDGTGCKESDLDNELSEVLTSISTVSKRIADRLEAYGSENAKGEHNHGKSKRLASTYS